MPSSILIRGTQGLQGIPGVDGIAGPAGPQGSPGMTTTFITSSQWWTCPANVNIVLVTLLGGGGGGSVLPYWNGVTAGNGYNGNSGQYIISIPLNVTPENSYYITIGYGGAAGTIDSPSGVYQNYTGNNGGTTSFSTLFAVLGGDPSIGSTSPFGTNGSNTGTPILPTGYGSGGYGGVSTGQYIGSAGLPGFCYISY